jgi:hypothetical protein
LMKPTDLGQLALTRKPQSWAVLSPNTRLSD